MCYALGGCQNTMDFYLDRLLGVEGNIRKRRDVASQSDLDYLVRFIKMAVDKYGPSTENNEIQDNVSFIMFFENSARCGVFLGQISLILVNLLKM